MNEDLNNNQVVQRPVLKKVKRPINRTPQATIQYSDVSTSATFASSNEKVLSFGTNLQNKNIENSAISRNNNDAFNLDAYLDEEPVAPIKDISKITQRKFLGEDDLPQYENKDDYVDMNNIQEESSNYFLYANPKILAVIAVFVFLIGFVTAKLFTSDEKVVRNGLQGVVINPEVPKGRARCGVAERTQGCILYLMNPQRQEIPARNLYDLAAQLTGRQRFVIETGNMRYSNTKIRPGDIAQFNIPPL